MCIRGGGPVIFIYLHIEDVETAHFVWKRAISFFSSFLYEICLCYDHNIPITERSSRIRLPLD